MDNAPRVALYERVSTDEQALHGYSIQTQKDTLEDYCKEKGYKIAGHYTDEGISGAKPPLKRPALKKLLDDVQSGKIDVIIFTKLDRWFRSIEQYYKVQEILDKHNVPWRTVLEDYNTATADGRLKVNIMLSVAANERERTSERIKAVIHNKFKNKVAAFGGDVMTLGYIRQKDENGLTRLVKDPATQHIVEEFWDLIKTYNNVRKATIHLNNKYNLAYNYAVYKRMKENELYTGEYRGIKGFCVPYISREAWLEIQNKPTIKRTPKNRIYLFTGLVKCPKCGKTLASCSTTNPNNHVEYKSYRCNNALNKLCDFRWRVSENVIEQYLLAHLANEINRMIHEVEIATAEIQKRPKSDVAKLKEKLRKLSVVYVNGAMSDDDFLSQTSELRALIEQASQEIQSGTQDITPLKKLLKNDWMALYATLGTEGKRAFWRSIIKEIHVEGKLVAGYLLNV